MNRRRFLLGSAAILAAPSIVPEAGALLPAGFAPVDIANAALSNLERAYLEPLIEAVEDLMLYGRCAVHVGPDGARVLDPLTDGPFGVLPRSVPSIPLATQREQFEAAYPYGGWWPEITRMEAEKPAGPAFPARPSPRPVA